MVPYCDKFIIITMTRNYGVVKTFQSVQISKKLPIEIVSSKALEYQSTRLVRYRNY